MATHRSIAVLVAVVLLATRGTAYSEPDHGLAVEKTPGDTTPEMVTFFRGNRDSASSTGATALPEALDPNLPSAGLTRPSSSSPTTENTQPNQTRGRRNSALVAISVAFGVAVAVAIAVAGTAYVLRSGRFGLLITKPPGSTVQLGSAI